MAKARRTGKGRVDLGDVIGKRLQPEQTDSVTIKPPEQQKSKVTESVTPKAPRKQTPKPTDSNTDTRPRYQRLIRKESRLTEGQSDELTVISRRLNRKRKGGERLTENTLIRVAVELLISRSGELEGNTEAELMASLGLHPTE